MTLVDSALRHTPLVSQHTALGARMVDFGGWEMPMHYGSQIDEHHAVRRGAGMFDVSHMCVIDVHGKDALEFLRAVLSNDVAKLKTEGKALYTCMLNHEGGILDDLLVYYVSDQFYRLIVNASRAQHDLNWLAQQIERLQLDVTLTNRRFGEGLDNGINSLAIIAVQGPLARERTWSVISDLQELTQDLKHFNAISHHDESLGEIMVARTGYTGEDGFELILPAETAPQLWTRLYEVGVHPAGLGARDTLRLEAGMNLYGQDMDEQTTPLDCGLGWTVDMKSERDFVGRTALQQQKPQWQTVGVVALERGGMFRARQGVSTPFGDGLITSGTFSPTMQQSIAIARIPKDVEPDAQVSVHIRGKDVSAKVVTLPFVRNGSVLV